MSTKHWLCCQIKGAEPSQVPLTPAWLLSSWVQYQDLKESTTVYIFYAYYFDFSFYVFVIFILEDKTTKQCCILVYSISYYVQFW